MANNCSLMLQTRTRKALRLHCAMHDLSEGETLSACLAAGIRQAAIERGKDFAERFYAAIGEVPPQQTPEAPERPEPVVQSSKRHTGYCLTPRARQLLKVYAAMADETLSAAADAAAWSWLLRLASQRSDDYWNAFTAALVQARYPEDVA